MSMSALDDETKALWVDAFESDAGQPRVRQLHWYEMAIFIVAALVLSGICIWWVRRRLV